VECAAYIDEADAEPTLARSGVYVLVAAVIDQQHLEPCQALLRSLLREEDTDLKGHSRLHLSRIRDRKRKGELVAVLGCLRGTRFVAAWAGGYNDPKDRERVRGGVLWELLPHLVAKEDVRSILIEQREDAKLRAADARVVGRLRDRGLLPLEVPVEQAPASTEPGLWLADAGAAAWRRRFAEGKDNWSRWYAPHTTLLDVNYQG
jgi:hypothetical protein